MKVLVVGSGGREHALCWKISQSKDCEALYCAPGNGGTQTVATNLDIAATDTAGVLRFCQAEGVGLVVIGVRLSAYYFTTSKTWKLNSP